MDKETARRVNELMLEASSHFDESVAFVRANCSETEFVAYRDSISKIMADLWFNVLKPMYVEHPDLEPDEVKQGLL